MTENQKLRALVDQLIDALDDVDHFNDGCGCCGLLGSVGDQPKVVAARAAAAQLKSKLEPAPTR